MSRESQINQAVILAAGRGSRLGELTDDQPKGALTLNGRSLIEWQIRALKGAGISNIVVVAGYASNWFNQFEEEITVARNEGWAETNMVASLMVAREFLSEPTIISYSDILYGPEVIRSLIRDEGDTAITYDTAWLSQWEKRFADPLLDAESFKIDQFGKLLEIGGKASTVDEIMGQYMGLLKFSPETLKAIDQITGESAIANMDMTSLLRMLITSGHPVYGVEVQGNWFEIDSESDYALAKGLLDSGELNLGGF